jgi:ribulose-5-phosphate 4-epimerase/fuculose-1-phosphate aldolase
MIDTERALRIDLAAAFRLAVMFDWHESVGNHFSAAVSEDGSSFLLNPRWQHFVTIRASDLLLLDANDPTVMQRPNAPDPSAWCIHGAIHRARPQARVLLHCHPPYTTALACLKDPTLKPIDQNTARFFGMVGIDVGYGGIADDAQEGARLAAAFGNHAILLMGNHGVTISAGTVAKTLMLAYASGQPLNIMSDALAEKTAHGWLAYTESGAAHFTQLKSLLDQQDPSYRD